MIRLKSNLLVLMLLLAVISITACGGNKISRLQYESGGTTSTAPSSQGSNPGPQPTLPPSSTATEGPDTTAEEVTLGSYSTKLLDKNPDRVNNIKIAIEVINGYVVQPGEIFSFNSILGKREAEKGYEKAKIIVNGKKKKAYGGGICQLSSTIYNAVAIANLEVVERHSHSKDVHYVPKGQDAAVNYGTRDFKFKNNMSYPITLYVSLANGKVHAVIRK